MIGYTYSAEYLGVNHKFDMIADDRMLVMGLRNHHSRRDAAVVAYAYVRIGDDPFAVPYGKTLAEDVEADFRAERILYAFTARPPVYVQQFMDNRFIAVVVMVFALSRKIFIRICLRL